MQIADSHLHRDAGMDLHSEDATQLAVGVLKIDAWLAVDPGLEMVALGANLVLVPIAFLEMLFA